MVPDRAEQRLRRLLDGLFSFVGLLDPDGLILEANQTALDGAGLRRDDVIGRPFWETPWWAASPEDRAQLRDAIVARPWWGDRPLRRRGLPCRRRPRHHGLPAGPVDRGRRGDRARAVRDRRHRSSQRGGAPPRLGRVRSRARRRRGHHGRGRCRPHAPRRVVRRVVRQPRAPRPVWSQMVHVLQPRDLDPDISSRYTDLSLDASTPLTDAIRSGETVVVDNPAVNVKRYPHLAADTVATGPRPPRRSRSGRTVRCRGPSASAGHDRSRRTPRRAHSTRWPTSPRARWPGRARSDTHAEFIDRVHAQMVSTTTPEASLDVADALRAGRAGSRLRRCHWYDVFPVSPTSAQPSSSATSAATASRRRRRWRCSADRSMRAHTSLRRPPRRPVRPRRGSLDLDQDLVRNPSPCTSSTPRRTASTTSPPGIHEPRIIDTHRSRVLEGAAGGQCSGLGGVKPGGGARVVEPGSTWRSRSQTDSSSDGDARVSTTASDASARPPSRAAGPAWTPTSSWSGWSPPRVDSRASRTTSPSSSCATGPRSGRT